jgi:hypothetical protein
MLPPGGLCNPELRHHKKTQFPKKAVRIRDEWKAFKLKTFHKRYFIIDQQIAQYFVLYSDCLSNPSSLLSNSNNQPFSYFKAHDKWLGF